MKFEQAKGIIERVFIVDLAGTFASLEKKGIIELLEKGEENKKYKAMFNDIGKHLYTDIEMEKAEIKAKYFPEPKKELVKLVQELDRAVKEILEEVIK